MKCQPRRFGAWLPRHMPSAAAGDGEPRRFAPAPSVAPHRRHLLVLGVAAIVGSAIGVPNASAHSRLVKSDPSARAVLAKVPKEVRLWFNEPIEPAFAKIWLVPTPGAKVDLVNRGDPADTQLLVATLPETIPEGPVVIGFRVLSVDGHVIESQLTFTVKKSA